MQSVKHMQIIFWAVVTLVTFLGLQKSEAQLIAHEQALVKPLQDTYEYWQKSMVLKNYNGWKAITATHRILAIQNRIHSEKGRFPADVFRTPTPPPTLVGLEVLRARSKGGTAKLVCFGNVNFGIGGEPSENILVISYVHEANRWKYDSAEFVNLGGLPEIRKQLKSGNSSYVDGEAFIPDGKRPVQPITVDQAKYIAKVYSYCPGRDVNVSVNKISKHRFQNTQQSEIVIGGARDGVNEIWYSVKDLPGYTGDEAMTIRVYIFSQINGVKPVKVFQYETKKGEKPKVTGSATFSVDSATAANVLGQ